MSIYSEYIKLFMLILDHCKYHKIDIYNIQIVRLYSDFFLRLFNHMDRNDAITLLNRSIHEKFKIPDINFNTDIQLVSTDHTMNNYNVKYVFKYKINNHPVSKHIELIKTIPNTTYDKIVDINREKAKDFFLLYIMCGFDSGHFLGLHPKIYNEISNYDPNTLECFASPFNHTLKNFYSLLPELDKYYGSKGNFFADFLDAPNTTYVINPPFEEFIMHKVFDLIRMKLSKPESCRIFLYLPQWDDLLDTHINEINEIPNINFRKCALNKNASIVYDYIKRTSINASFATYFMYFDNHDCVFCDKHAMLCEMQKK